MQKMIGTRKYATYKLLPQTLDKLTSLKKQLDIMLPVQVYKPNIIDILVSSATPEAIKQALQNFGE